MKKLNISAIVALCLFIPLVHARDGETKLSTSTKAGQIVINVSPSGSDRSDGSIKRPLKSIIAAQASVRSAKKKGYQDICVILHVGTYKIENTIFFGPEDSGIDEHPVVWKTYEGETPVISGGIGTRSWQKGDNGIWQTKLERTEKLRQLYINDKPAKLSQYKKQVKGQGGYGKYLVKGDEPWAFRQGEGVDGILVNKSDMPVIAHPEDLEMRTQTTWTMNRVCVRGIKEEGLCCDISIANNLIRETGIEHQPSVALMAYFGDGLTITHNDIAFAPYTGINLGWGWGVFNSPQEGSKIKPRCH